MKATVIYHSESGNTQKMAGLIVESMQQTAGVEAKAFSIDAIDEAWLADSKCVVLGTPTYYADLSGKVKLFLESCGKYDLGGRLGGAFATAAYQHGGADLAIQNVLTHMMFFGMLTYSGGCACGNPPIHLGPVYINGQDALEENFRIYGRRMAAKAVELFGK